jgi:hypothetical protein
LEVGQVLVGIHYSGICGKQIDEIVGPGADPYLRQFLGVASEHRIPRIRPA